MQGETTITQERLQPPHKGWTHMGELNMLSVLSKMYAVITNLIYIYISRYENIQLYNTLAYHITLCFPGEIGKNRINCVGVRETHSRKILLIRCQW